MPLYILSIDLQGTCDMTSMKKVNSFQQNLQEHFDVQKKETMTNYLHHIKYSSKWTTNLSMDVHFNCLHEKENILMTLA